MNPTQKQFSQNRGASRKQIPISNPQGANYYGVFPNGGEEAEGSANRTDGGHTQTVAHPMPRDTSDSQATTAFFTINQTSGSLLSLPQPAVIVLSKVDIYDNAGALQELITQSNYELIQSFPAFRIFHKRQSGQ